MKIKKIEAFLIRDLGFSVSEESPQARRRSWYVDAEVASPMDRYTRFKGRRSSWAARLPAVGVLATAEDETWGFATTACGQPVVSLINDHFAPLLVGEDPMATERIWDMMMRFASLYSPSGLASYGISAVDLALWDLKGRLLRRPVYELAGGPARESQKCYATGNDTDWHMELGFSATKLACPYGSAGGLQAINKDEELVARTRELIGDQVDLMLDCWMALDVDFAVRLAERLRPYNLRWIEDGLRPEDGPSHRALRERLPWQALATGEHWYTPSPFYDAAKGNLVDILQPDVHWVGGLTAARRISAIADAAGIEVILHAGMNTPYGQHAALATTSSEWGEYFVGGAPGVALSKTHGFPGMAVPANGVLVVSDEPGFGHGLTLESIAKLTL
ncbi:MAG: hypothetical protein JNL14_21240 [Devosia sp.]|uniref:enolase C-terminal domain-like protein n=1 Tax=Devosia sp. TaxID=1871048 RepID=UPI001A48205F|nr:enolase C-terminal domain-like protein [Devosia sp.]MBL8600272.1 hypothetical protein [Devosia sp.]